MQKYKILISAYACSPYNGSEPGMGWNFVLGLSRYHEVHVITEKRKWEAPINKFLKENSALNQNLKFYFIEKKRNKKLRKIWPPSYYWFYRKWQKEAYQFALELDNRENFELVHQLNMVGYREPGYLWKIDKPFVWGPIGGLENSPWRFLPSLGFKGLLFYTSRNLINLWQRNFNSRPRKAVNHINSSFLAATPGDAELINKIWKREAEVICEVGQDSNTFNSYIQRSSSDPLIVVWSGMHTAGKNLSLLLHAFKNTSISYELHILGEGEMTRKWNEMAIDLNINEYCTWYGWVTRERAIKVMQTGHVFCITSIKDLTASVTLESLSYGLPIVCLDHCGFADVVTDKCGIKIPVDSPANASKNFREAFLKLYENEELRQELSKGAIERAKDFTWDKKIEKLNRIYTSLLKRRN